MKVFLCISESIRAAGLQALIGSMPGFEYSGSSFTLTGQEETFQTMTGEIVVVDLGLGVVPVMNFCRKFGHLLKVVVVLQEDIRHSIFVSYQMAGLIRGMLKWNCTHGQIFQCLLDVSHDEIQPTTMMSPALDKSHLTPREYEIVGLVYKGMRNKHIADTLSITVGTVKVHLQHIFEKMDVKDRSELAIKAAPFFQEPDRSSLQVPVLA